MGPTFARILLSIGVCSGQTLPAWLSIGAEQRSRYETEDVRYRLGESGGDQQVALRARLRASVNYRRFFSTAEVQDARVALTDRGSTITSQQENFTHLLQGYVGFRFQSGSRKYQASIEAGRFSRAVGSGRLVGAEAFRNTSSVYDGATFSFGTQLWTAQMFYFHPVLYTYPDVKVNPAFRDARLGGLDYSFHWKKNTLLEAFVVHNHDGASAPVLARRDFINEGGRITAHGAQWDYQAEGAYQHGRLGVAPHRAWFTHLEVGYGPDVVFRPRFTLQYDYASGDRDPGSGVSHAFDPLFGVRRADLGPTGIWSLQLRSNLNSPSARMQVTPFRNAEFTLHHHWMYLAQARDHWRGVGLADPAGNAGRSVGQQTEFRLRYRWSKFLDSETAYVHFREGTFVRALRPSLRGSAGYFYISTDLHF